MWYKVLIFVAVLPLTQLSAIASVLYSTVSIEADGHVSFSMRKGPIKEQLIELLKSHPRLKDPSKIIWEAKSSQWPIDAAYKDETIDGVINDICSQVDLTVTYYPNGYFVVRDLELTK